MVIFFNVPEARTQLLDKGLVYTLRPRKRKQEGETTAVQGSYFSRKTVCKVNVGFVEKISFAGDLTFYVKQSGFKTIIDWQKATKDAKFLYKVTKA